MPRNEIGSEFWDVPVKNVDNGLFPTDTEWFISGRSALQAIIEDVKKYNGIQTVAIPDWCCDSMIIPFVRSGVSVEFYPALNPIENIKTDAILVMDYFGYTGNSNIGDYAGVIIRDLTHSILSGQYDDADYYFGSLRKWAGLLTGGYAWGFKYPVKYSADNTSYVELREKAMHMKADYINGNTNSKEYLEAFAIAEEELNNVGIYPAADRDIQAAGKLDVNRIKAQRRKNAMVLIEAFKDNVLFPYIGDDDCPMFVPIRVRDRNDLRNHLIQQEIYCPIHWPTSDLHHPDKATERLYNEELSLVCDQRYTEKDMMRIVRTIKKYYSNRESIDANGIRLETE